MWHSPAGPHGRGHLTLAAAGRWLLIGNSRWHWAERLADGRLHGWDGEPASGPKAPLAWAAVGPPPDPELCPPERRVELADVPLMDCPPWLGVDRALAGWGAWRELGESVLVVDAGTVLSLTRVDDQGRFRGGRLLAGVRLQLEAMTAHTTLIPQILNQQEQGATREGDRNDPGDWPTATAEAMEVGVLRGLAAAVREAAGEAQCRSVVLTGGDGPLLLQRVGQPLQQQGLAVAFRPLLCLESLACLRPAP
jgi:type III pantothenate kinase